MLERTFGAALRQHFDRQPTVACELVAVRVRARPRRAHPAGWDAFQASLSVRDLSMPNERAFPRLDLDVAAPEQLGADALRMLDVGAHRIVAYGLSRIAGEKLRAYLTSLPEYRGKMSRPSGAVRVKDLYDLARIAKNRPLATAADFWRSAGEEFRLACRSRYVDCGGLATFRQDWEQVAVACKHGGIVPSDIPFADAARVLAGIVAFFEAAGILPLRHPVPD